MALIREKRIEEILEDDLSMLGRGSSATYEGKVGVDFQRLLGDRSALNLENIQQNSDRVRLRSSSSEQVPKVIPGPDGKLSQVNGNHYNSQGSPTKLLSSVTNINSDLETEHLFEDTVADSSDIINTKMSHTDELEPAASILLDQPESHNSSDQSKQSSGSNNKSQQKATAMSVRCHCNLAACVTNNYMCKSERRVTEDGKELEAGCFVQELETESTSQHGVLMWNGRVANARRGCIEMLSREKQEKCSDQAGDQVFCCKDDMCNYPKSFYPSVIQNYNSNARASFDASSGHRGGIAGMTPNLDHQVWLRAAVIAVPICGLMILVVLILVARRLLRSDEIYKDPDGRRCRRKFTNTSVPHNNHHLSSSLSHHHYQLAYHPSNSRGGFSPEPNFHIKSVYVEPGNEFLLPPEPICSHCQQPQHVRTSSSSSTTAPYAHDGSGRKNNNTNSETEELVRSCNANNNCRCSSGVGGGSGGTESTCSGNFSDTESHGGRSFSWNSIRPLSVFSGSSPDLPDVHRNNNGQEGKNSTRFNFLSKLNRSRSSQSDTNSDSNRQFNV